MYRAVKLFTPVLGAELGLPWWHLIGLSPSLFRHGAKEGI